MSIENTYAMIEEFSFPVASGGRGYLNAIARYPILSQKDENELAHELRRSGDKRAAWALVCTHLRQVVTIVRGYRGYGLAENDLIQEGNIGLMKAVKKFDPDRNVRLSTYATHWIKAAIGEYIIANWKTIKVASTTAQRKLFYRLRSFTSKLGRRLTKEDAKMIAEKLDVNPNEVIEMDKRLSLPEVPFVSPATNSEEIDTSPSATLVSENGNHAELITIKKSIAETKHQALLDAFAQLSERERLIVEARGLSASGKDTNLKDLATQLHISAERVRQLEKKAMQKIKKNVLRTCAHLFA